MSAPVAKWRAAARASTIAGWALGIALVALLSAPLMGLSLSAPPAELVAGARHPLFDRALGLSLRTSSLALALVVLTGTPLGFWLGRSRARGARLVETLIDLPIVIPPAVLGVALLETFGRRGLLGGALESLGLALPFSTAAVVIAQIVVSAPFYVQAASSAFRRVDADLLLVARTLGASPAGAFLRVGVPLALPGLLGGAALCWARSLGEFGATLLFAGNLPGTTQTMPLAIYATLESDLRAATSLSVALGAIAVGLLLALRAVPRLLSARDRHDPLDPDGGRP